MLSELDGEKGGVVVSSRSNFEEDMNAWEQQPLCRVLPTPEVSDLSQIGAKNESEGSLQYLKIHYWGYL